MNWKRLKKFLCGGRNNGPINNFSDTHLAQTDPFWSDRMIMPVRTVRAAALKPYGKHNKFTFFQHLDLFISHHIKQKAANILWILSVILLTILFLEMCLGFWIAHLSLDRFRRLTSCLDAGSVSSWKERFVYHTACFIGIL